MANTFDTFEGDGLETDFNYTFDLTGSFSTVVVGLKSDDEPNYGVQAGLGVDYTHTAASKLISFTVAPVNGEKGIIRRSTSLERPAAYIDGTTLTPTTLNNDTKRLTSVDQEQDEVIPDMRSAELLVADMPTVGVPSSIDMGIEANLLIVTAKMDGTHDVTYAINVPVAGENVQTSGTAIGTGATFGPELRFERSSDPNVLDVTMINANAFTAWTQIKMTALRTPTPANL